jgi:eukaryotic-like serine/threonine-protein kinase
MVPKQVPGPSAARLERAVGPLAPRAAAELVAGAAHAVGWAHQAGLVHGGITLEQLFPGHGGVVRVAAPGPRPGQEPSTRNPGMAVSDLPFAPPEQLRGRPITPAADVYALGVALYHLLTGRLPWPAGPAGLVAGRVRRPPRPASSLRDGIPTELDEILARALAITPGDRYPDGRALAAALEGWLGRALLPEVPGTGLAGEAAAAAIANAIRRARASSRPAYSSGEPRVQPATLEPPAPLRRAKVPPAILVGAALWATAVGFLALVGMGVLAPSRPSGIVLDATGTPQVRPATPSPGATAR